MNAQNIPPKESRMSNYNKHTRVWLRKWREFLQQEFDRERLNLIATSREVTKCPSLGGLTVKQPVKPKIISSVILTKRYQLRDQWDKIQLRANGTTQPKPPLICIVTSLHAGIDQEPVPVRAYPSPEKKISPVKEENLRPVFMCRSCLIQPKNEVYIGCFERNYYYIYIYISTSYK